jgi:hypothetical protein
MSRGVKLEEDLQRNQNLLENKHLLHRVEHFYTLHT